MTSGRPPAPPVIPGFTFLRALGSGGYSRVYLYEQHMPRREVAVKVMHDVAVSATSRFEHEANLMAKVSSHPAILSIYGAGVSEGRYGVKCSVKGNTTLHSSAKIGRASCRERV